MLIITSMSIQAKQAECGIIHWYNMLSVTLMSTLAKQAECGINVYTGTTC